MEVQVDIFLNETVEILENIMPGFESRKRMDNIVATLRVDVSCFLMRFGDDVVSFDLFDGVKGQLVMD